VEGLEFDFSKRFLPLALCGDDLPEWMSEEQRLKLNQIRGYSYAHIFYFFEEFIVAQTCSTVNDYVYVDREAVSAILKFAEEETKHQRLFAFMKERLVAGFGFKPEGISGKEEAARQVCSHSDFAVYLLCLVTEWLTQRHYVECFKEEVDALDSSFVKVFRLHWTEEAQHARLDQLLLNELRQTMNDDELATAHDEFEQLLRLLEELLVEQSKLDLKTFESAYGVLNQQQHSELLQQLCTDWRWTFIVSGLEQKAFKNVYQASFPESKIRLANIVSKMTNAPAAH